ncbi:MAG TPA: hypothetical protein VIH99_07460 [Bdellovibrionota bacterium]|jgi:predicted  nucleic acid-binding Zn-ribbon protein
MKRILPLAFFLAACAGAPAQHGSGKPTKTHLQHQMAALDSQILDVDARINSARARLQHAEAIGEMGARETMAASAQGELSGYEAEKAALVAQKASLQYQLNSIH